LLCCPLSYDEVYQSDVNICTVTRPMAAGTRLNADYFADSINEDLRERRERVVKETGAKCDCDRCQFEERNRLDPSTGVYREIGCPDCRSLMVRDGHSADFYCSDESCHKTMTIDEMKAVYEELKQMEGLILEGTFKNGAVESNYDKFIELFYRGSEELAVLYHKIAFHFVKLFASTANTDTVRRHELFRLAWYYMEMALSVYEEAAGGPGVERADTYSAMSYLAILSPKLRNLQLDHLRERCNELSVRYQKLSAHAIKSPSLPLKVFNTFDLSVGNAQEE